MDATSNLEIIEATQSAVLKIADNVNEVFEAGGHHGPFYLSAEFWVAVSFVLVVVGLTYPIIKMARKMLGKRARLIAKRIEDATNLKEDAQKLLAEYERKYRRAKQEAQEILQRSEREVNLLRKESMQKLENVMDAKEREAKARIKSAQTEAFKEISDLTSQKTIEAVKVILKGVVSVKDHNRMIEESITELEKITL